MSERLLRLCALSGFLAGIVACSSSSPTSGDQSLDAGHDTSAGACWSPSDCIGSSFGSGCVFPGETACGVCIIPMNSCSSDSDCVGDGAVPRICDPQPCVCGGTGFWCTDGCTQDTDCGVGQTCAANHHCGAPLCSAPGQSCPPDFACSSGGTCFRKTCTSDTDCSKACVDGQCFDTPGRCSNSIP